MRMLVPRSVHKSQLGRSCRCMLRLYVLWLLFWKETIYMKMLARLLYVQCALLVQVLRLVNHEQIGGALFPMRRAAMPRDEVK